MGAFILLLLLVNCSQASLEYYNPSPNATTNEWLSVNLSIQATEKGKPTRWDLAFQTNDTNNGSWVTIKTLHNVMVPNSTLKTIYTWFSGLDWNKTYYWRVVAYNATLGIYSNSSIYHFTTRLTDPEPNITYYSMGAQIRVVPQSPPDVHNPWSHPNLLLLLSPFLLLSLVLIIIKKRFQVKIYVLRLIRILE